VCAPNEGRKNLLEEKRKKALLGRQEQTTSFSGEKRDVWKPNGGGIEGKDYWPCAKAALLHWEGTNDRQYSMKQAKGNCGLLLRKQPKNKVPDGENADAEKTLN